MTKGRPCHGSRRYAGRMELLNCVQMCADVYNALNANAVARWPSCMGRIHAPPLPPVHVSACRAVRQGSLLRLPHSSTQKLGLLLCAATQQSLVCQKMQVAPNCSVQEEQASLLLCATRSTMIGSCGDWRNGVGGRTCPSWAQRREPFCSSWCSSSSHDLRLRLAAWLGTLLSS